MVIVKKFSEIIEGLKITSKSRVNETYKPKTTEELALTIKNLVNERGLEADLNDIDLSYITDISFAFQYVTKFNGDISLWDVSHIKYMGFLFKGIKFEGDIIMGFYDSKGYWRNDGDGFYDSKGYYRNSGDSYYDSKGYYRHSGDSFYDGKGDYRQPGSGYYDSKGNWRK